MMPLGARQAKYFGKAKSQLQWLLAATVANLILAIKGKTKKRGPGKDENASDALAAWITPLSALLRSDNFGQSTNMNRRRSMLRNAA